MNNVLACLRRGMVPLFGILAAGVFLSACLKNKDDDYSNIPAAGLMAFNLAPDQPSAVVRLSGNSLTNVPLAFGSFNGGYQNIYVGSRAVESFRSFDYPAQPLAAVNFNFENGKYYSVFVAGAHDTYRNIVSEDNLDSLPVTSDAYVRYINAIPDSSQPAVTVAVNGNNVINDNAGFGAVSEFKAVAPGQINIAVNNGGTIQSSRTITVEQRKVYTILLAGLPNAADSSQKVQIRFIVNGTLTDDPGK
jgi:hypothetical protein